MLVPNWHARILPTRVVSIWTLHTGRRYSLVAWLSLVRAALLNAAIYPGPIQATLFQLRQFKKWQSQWLDSRANSCSKCAQSRHLWPTLFDAGGKPGREAHTWGTYETSVLDCSLTANATLYIFAGDVCSCLTAIPFLYLSMYIPQDQVIAKLLKSFE